MQLTENTELASTNRELLSEVNPETRSLKQLCSSLIEKIGEDPNREGLVKTPERFAKAMLEMTAGYQQDIDSIVNGAIFDDENSEIIVVKNIEVHSLCEHHLLPFFGKAHIAYIPNGKILGLSKLPRIVDMYGRRLQVQERLTKQIVEQIQNVVNPKGVICRIEATHMCMKMRGVKSSSSSMVTQSTSGVFRTEKSLRDEFRQLTGPTSENTSGESQVV